MWSFSRDKHNCYCAFCKSPRRIYRKKDINLFNIIAAAFSAGAIMLLLWQTYDPRVMIVFVVCLAMAEAFVKFRWRLSMPCAQCGFDPILYVKNPERAAALVKEKLDRRKEDPKYLLSKPLNLPAIPAEKAKALQNKEKRGQIVSRQI